MSLSLAPLPAAQVGQQYAVNLAQFIQGGRAPYTVLSGPSGIVPNSGTWLSYNASTGVLSGVPPTAEVEVIAGIVVLDSSTPFPKFNSVGGTLTVSISTAQPYLARITSEHNQKPDFMSAVQTLCAGVADTTAVIAGLPTAFALGTAQGAQLDVVGQWVGQSRVIPDVVTINFFGFSQALGGSPGGATNFLTFGEATNPSVGARFYNYGETYTVTTTLSDTEYTTVLRAVITRNQFDGTVADIEEALMFIFGAACKVIDFGTLSVTISVPASSVTAVDLALISTLDILPRPAGVSYSVTTF